MSIIASGAYFRIRNSESPFRSKAHMVVKPGATVQLAVW